MNLSKPAKRAAYSHSGCMHCKALKQKCDELKPSCSACLKHSHECVYSRSIIMWSPENKKKRRAKTAAGAAVATAAAATTAGKPVEMVEFKIESPEYLTIPSFYNYTIGAGTGNSNGSAVSDNNIGSRTNLEQNNNYTATSYVSPVTSEESSNPNSDWSLFDLESDRPYRDVPTPVGGCSPVTDPPSPVREEVFLYNMPHWTFRESSEWRRIMQAYRPSSFDNEYDLQLFLQHAFLRCKCGLNYPFGLDEKNPLWQNLMILLGKYDFLRFAVCAMACLVLELQCNSSEWGPYRKKYTDLCMQALIAKIADYEGKTETTALLCTVMILFSEKSASSSNKWRLHLHGAYDLLRNGMNYSGRDEESQLFGVMKTWFSMAETLAWLSSPGGGTMDISSLTSDEIKNILDDSKSAYEVRDLVIDDFNTFKGYSQDLVTCFALTVEKVIQQRKGLLDWNDKDLTGILIQIEILQEQNFQLSAVPQESVRQAMRDSHRIHCFALRVFIMTQLQGYYYSNNDVQQVVDEGVACLAKMPLFDTLGVTVHWAAFSLGRASIKIEQRSVVEAKLNSIIAVGARVARNSLHRLYRYWDNYDEDEISNIAADVDSIAF